MDYAAFKPSICHATCYCTSSFGLHVNWDVVFHSSLGGVGDAKLKILISIRGIRRTAHNISQTHCKPSSLSKCCSAEWLSSLSRCSCVASGLLASMRKTGGIPQAWDGLFVLPSREDATALTSLAAWGWGAALWSWGYLDGLMAAAATLLCSSTWFLTNCFPRYVGKSKSRFSTALERVHNL